MIMAKEKEVKKDIKDEVKLKKKKIKIDIKTLAKRRKNV